MQIYKYPPTGVGMFLYVSAQGIPYNMPSVIFLPRFNRALIASPYFLKDMYTYQYLQMLFRFSTLIRGIQPETLSGHMSCSPVVLCFNHFSVIFSKNGIML